MGEVPVGGDVEQIRSIRPSMAKKCLTQDEYAVYEACASREEKADLFFRYWTCKESAWCVKSASICVNFGVGKRKLR